MENRLAVIGIIIEEMDSAAPVNELLHQHSQYIVGRMGIPYRSREISVITIVMDAPEQVISTLSGKLGMLPGVSVKSMLAKSQEKRNEAGGIFEALQNGFSPGAGEIIPLLSDAYEQELFDTAHQVKLARFGNQVRIRALLEFSNCCRRQCAYCGLHSANREIGRYRMEPDAIVAQSLKAWEAGYQTIVLQSGEDPWYTADLLCDIVRKIKAQCKIAVTLSVGERDLDDYRRLKACGADRYLLKHETADEKIYASLHPCGTLENRVSCLKELKRLGYETGSGFMIGLPGQTAETIAKDLLLLREIPCDMAGIGPFIPHPQTRLKDLPPGSTRMTARAVAAARLLLPDANLPATTSLGVLNQAENRHIFSCGANVIMKKVTPLDYQRLYEIYPSPKAASLDIPGGRKKLEETLRSLGLDPV